ncbi:MAG: hypothetical protein ACLRVB_12360 [Blautia sp.]
MEEKKEKLVVDGNAVYEIDMDCVKKRQRRTGGNGKNSTGSHRPENFPKKADKTSAF